MRRNDGMGDLFWMEFRKWVQSKIERGELRVFTNKRLFLIFKKEYLPEYVKNHNGVHHAYMDLITYDDVSRELFNCVILFLLKNHIVERVGRKKYRVNGHDRNGKMHVKAGGFDAKTAIREVDGGDEV